jgi:protein-disulfide isomerase
MSQDLELLSEQPEISESEAEQASLDSNPTIEQALQHSDEDTDDVGDLDLDPDAYPAGGLEDVDDLDDDVFVIKRKHVYTALIPIAFILGIGAGFLFWGRGDQPAAPVAQAETTSSGDAAPAVPDINYDEVRRYDISIDDDPIFGPADAPITIIEFSDYECPFCQRWHAQVFDRLLETYPNEIRFVYRDFPLVNIHPNAIPAAIAANCAGEQGQFWPFHNSLFSGVYGLGTQAYVQYASEIGMDVEAFSACMSDNDYSAEVQADFEYASNLGVSSTPTFFLNGIAIVGAQSYEVFQQVVEAELAGEIPK